MPARKGARVAGAGTGRAGRRGQSNQLGLVVLAAVALLVTAGLAGGGLGLSPDGLDESRTPDIEPPEFDWDRVGEIIERLLELLEFENGGGESACTIGLSNQPTPGAETTAYVLLHGEPLTDASVWFNGEYVGTTDESGAVTGPVPYERQLEIHVETAGGEECTARDSIGGAQLGSMLTPSLQPQTDPGANSSVQFDVTGAVRLSVIGEPYPGETVDIQATVSGIPMADATVMVEGSEVGTTDDEGLATVDIPADGRSELAVEVNRGDFRGSAVIDVLALQARLEPDGITPVPGTDGQVVATIQGDPVADATVTVDGETVGTTDGSGQLAMDLPMNPLSPVTVQTDRQSVRITLFGQFAPILLVGLVLVLIGCVGGYWYGGWRGTGLVLGGTGSVLAVLVAEGIWGTAGAAIAAGLVLVPWVALLVQLLRGRVSIPRRERPALSRPTLAGLGDRLVSIVLWLVTRIEAGIDWVQYRIAGLLEWGRSQSIRTALVGLLERVGAALQRAIESVIASRRAIAIVVVSIGALVMGYLLGGSLGLLLVGVLLVVAAAAAIRWRTGAEQDRSEPGPPADGAVETTGPMPLEDREQFREWWRSFARRVTADQWETTAPGEVERVALELGYPRHPVTSLTATFRSVEYGGKPLTDTAREQARVAYRSITIWRADDPAEEDES